MAISAHAFILFEVTRSENNHFEDLPVAVMVRLSESLKDRVVGTQLDVESDFFRRAELNVKPEDVRWLSMLAFRKDNTVAPIDDWFDPERDQIIFAGDSNNMEFDDGRVEYDQYCTVYTAQGMPVSTLTLEKHSGVILLGAQGETTQHFALGSICAKWDEVAKAIGEEPVAAETQRMEG